MNGLHSRKKGKIDTLEQRRSCLAKKYAKGFDNCHARIRFVKIIMREAVEPDIGKRHFLQRKMKLKSVLPCSMIILRNNDFASKSDRARNDDFCVMEK